ncbi:MULTISPECIES: hypothetical protein [unclassified Gilliamella]|uniref:hypothetical protein n=1 Tax=unclassified Gilliamella TaxID=2685620 RepID=UPI000A34E0E4|nr:MULTISPECIES: hypothetical protein [unclassified Gilliamella]OTQ70929.1 hypothetical protein B6C99_12630 [Gilliamella sp. N-G2]OTQ76942.1 hypothetical protein B6D23_12545 [Gilliamella sp. N-W3]
MLIEILQKYFEAKEKLRLELRNHQEQKYFLDNISISEGTLLLEELLRYNKQWSILQFELLLRLNKDAALAFIKDYYLEQDLANHIDNKVHNLKTMFTEIKNILGKEELIKVLKCKEFRPANKRNKKVKEAIKFALNKD